MNCPTAQARKEIARRFLLAIAARDAAAMRAVLAPEAHLTLMIAGAYSPDLRAFPQGIQWDRDGLIRMEMQFQQQLDGPFALEILALVAEGDSVAAEAIGKGRRATTGRSYVQHYSYHFRIVGDRIADIRLYQDTFHHWDVWNDSRHAVEPAYMRARHTGAAPEQPAEPASDAVAEDEITANKKAVRRFLRAVRDRDPQATRASWSPAGMWSFAVGEHYSPELRAFHGAPRWNLEGMINMQLNSASNSREPMTLDIYSLIAEEDRLSAEAVGFLIRDSGRSYRQHYSFHFKARHGRLIEGHVYQDTLHMYDVTRDPPGETPVAVPITSPT